MLFPADTVGDWPGCESCSYESSDVATVIAAVGAAVVTAAVG